MLPRNDNIVTAEPKQKKHRAHNSKSVRTNGKFVTSLRNNVLGLFFKKNEHPLVTSEESSFQYHTARPHLHRASSFIVYVDKKQQFMEIYVPRKKIGSGGNGSLRLFTSTTDSSRHVVVKQRLFKNENPECGSTILRKAMKILKEAVLMQQVNSDLGIFQIHYITNEKLDYRFIMPFIDGMTFNETLANIDTADEFKQLILAIAKEVHRVHLLNILHDDLNDGNVLCKKVINEKTGRNEYIVKCIDFGFANKIDENNRIAETAPDVEAIAEFIHKGMEKFSMSDKYSDLACLEDFTNMLMSDSLNKPSLQDFIELLTTDISTNVAHQYKPRV